jgi:hypothetical protein
MVFAFTTPPLSACRHATPYINGYIFQCVLTPRRTAAVRHCSFNAARSVSKTKQQSTDSEDPLVEMENTIGFSACKAAYCVVVGFVTDGRSLELVNSYVMRAFKMSHAAKRNLPNDGWRNSFGASRSPNNGVYR